MIFTRNASLMCADATDERKPLTSHWRLNQQARPSFLAPPSSLDLVHHFFTTCYCRPCISLWRMKDITKSYTCSTRTGLRRITSHPLCSSLIKTAQKGPSSWLFSAGRPGLSGTTWRIAYASSLMHCSWFVALMVGCQWWMTCQSWFSH